VAGSSPGGGEPPRQTRVLKLRPGVSVQTALARLRRRHVVLWAKPDYVARTASTSFIPDDPGTSHVPGGWRSLQWNFVGPFGVGAPEAWANLIADGEPGGRDVTVAVLDTGVAYENRGKFLRSPDFEASQFVKGHDFVANTPYPDDRNGHGTFVAGTIAEATNNGRGLTGLAYGVKIMPVRVLDASGEGDASTIARGVRFAVDHGAKVINLSLEFSGEVTAADVPELVSAFSYAHERGVVIVAAAGNEGSTDVPYPARDRFAIAVGASTEHGCLADYSNYGSRIDLVAPGGGADANLPEDPDCRPNGTPGRDVYQETFMGSSPRVFGFPDGYEGTSMASPEVAATAALVIASGVLGPNPAPAAVRWRLEQTARPLGGPSDAADYSHGLVDAAAATAPGGPGALASRHTSTGASVARH
jgi:serine protease